MIEEIKQRLSKITKGPWEYIAPKSDYDDHEITTVGENGVWIASTTYDGLSTSKQHNYVEDADFIAHAPSDIAYLLEHNQALVEALEWYASAENHKKQWTKASDNEWYSSVETDEGNRAIAALTTYKGEEA